MLSRGGVEFENGSYAKFVYSNSGFDESLLETRSTGQFKIEAKL